MPLFVFSLLLMSLLSSPLAYAVASPADVPSPQQVFEPVGAFPERLDGLQLTELERQPSRALERAVYRGADIAGTAWVEAGSDPRATEHYLDMAYAFHSDRGGYRAERIRLGYGEHGRSLPCVLADDRQHQNLYLVCATRFDGRNLILQPGVTYGEETSFNRSAAQRALIDFAVAVSSAVEASAGDRYRRETLASQDVD
ncbi:hypothetical protein [Halotalea alkalilenta]|uniref:hypothetical protein n=1 Tax=Halotalea alkalilenta TaxID=376489 RepID=UPI00048185E5|nr:hypothetical protein [Halotalea alkalilenta]